MSRSFPLLVLTLASLSTPLAAQQGKRCLLDVDNVDREGFRSEPIVGNTNFFAGGNVRLSCRGQDVRLGGDSLASLGGNVIILTTAAFYRDATLSVKADTLTYFKNGEQIQARGNVIARSMKSGSMLTGPHVDYFRAVNGLRDSAETVAIQRPTLRVFSARGLIDSTKDHPYVIVADRMRGFGGSEMRGAGNVTVDRDSLHGTGDSLFYRSGRLGTASLYGAPASLRRLSSDSFQVEGREVRLGIDNESLREIQAFGDGHVTNGTSDIRGESVALTLTDEKLSQTLAWSSEPQATVHNAGYDVRGDSIAIDTPDEKIRELRVYRRGMVQNPLDSTAALPSTDTTGAAPRDRDTLWGERIIASFVQVDSAGTEHTKLQQIEAVGSARSLFSRIVAKNGTTTPSINYTRADTIVVVMKGGDSTGVSIVRAHGSVDGMQLETASIRKARPDSAAAASKEKRP
jgi:hypothetical protein